MQKFLKKYPALDAAIKSAAIAAALYAAEPSVVTAKPNKNIFAKKEDAVVVPLQKFTTQYFDNSFHFTPNLQSQFKKYILPSELGSDQQPGYLRSSFVVLPKNMMVVSFSNESATGNCCWKLRLFVGKDEMIFPVLDPNGKLATLDKQIIEHVEYGVDPSDKTFFIVHGFDRNISITTLVKERDGKFYADESKMKLKNSMMH